jgi:hypothetical protein
MDRPVLGHGAVDQQLVVEQLMVEQLVVEQLVVEQLVVEQLMELTSRPVRATVGGRSGGGAS